MNRLLARVIGVLCLGVGLAHADEASLRKNLAERLPQLAGAINEVSKTGVPGLYEVRVHDNELLYADDQANYLIQGNLLDLRSRRNLTEERIDKLTGFNFKAMPFKDAFKIVRGNGKRQVAVFEDPNCGYCKRFEKDLQKINNVTVHVFLYPILSPDSTDKSKAIWCAKDPAKAWQDWMLNDVKPTAAATCDTGALQRNLALGRKHKVNGTPTLVFADNTRVPGAVGADQVEKRLGAGS